ncbi:MAG: ATP-binding protein [Candidatus Kapabacteria bacterium]|nr:ATP-binding protein [Candidatus Kapabacteria bacterium]
MKYDFKYLEDLIANKFEENLHLDYKAAEALSRSDGKRKEISKDVSAMANSDGGVIIYGIRETNNKELRYIPEKIDPVNRNEFSKEWLEQIISSHIQPKIPNLQITPISISDSDVVYVVKIPKGDTAFMAGDKRYYKRYNFESVPMDDYEVKDIMNRATHPKIFLEFVISEGKETDLFSNSNETKRILYVYCRNSGKVYAKFINYFIKIPAKMLPEQLISNYKKIEFNEIPYILFTGDNSNFLNISAHSTEKDKSNIESFRNTPLLPGLKRLFASIQLADNCVLDSNIILWNVYADNAPMNESTIKLSYIEKQINWI